MKTEINKDDIASIDVSSEFMKTVTLPETATIAQHKEFTDKVKSIVSSPMDAINTAFFDVFGEEIQDDIDLNACEELAQNAA